MALLSRWDPRVSSLYQLSCAPDHAGETAKNASSPFPVDRVGVDPEQWPCPGLTSSVFQRDQKLAHWAGQPLLQMCQSRGSGLRLFKS